MSNSIKNNNAAPPARPPSVLDTRIIYCGDCLDQLHKLPERSVDLIYIDPPFNSNRNYEVFWGNVSEPRAQASGFFVRFEDRHDGTRAYIDYKRPRCALYSRFVRTCRGRLSAIPRQPYPLGCPAADRLLCHNQR